MQRAGQTPHGARPNREGPGVGVKTSPGITCRLGASQPPGRSLEPRSNARPRGMTVLLEKSGRQNSAYRSGCHISRLRFSPPISSPRDTAGIPPLSYRCAARPVRRFAEPTLLAPCPRLPLPGNNGYTSAPLPRRKISNTCRNAGTEAASPVAYVTQVLKTAPCV